ncbi:MAG: two-component sensor histidine kinase [Microbacterium sp.]|uniref:sensor histidine kinase n=1 Tax=Microbacterium aquimaris TaxID=459816 RepID=UPI000C9631F0|nr:HAMP domain-containing sensor histidine kinase [Microbacterium aquimaris]MAP63600.1 two-component sensor histidine kinase [Microbacterium sp.]MDZ8275537.1 HAMP domain-containing sensor histidine kinase [Microbacterium aquimaris]
MSALSRPLSARARILAAIVTVAAVGLIVVGGVTFLAQRERTLTAVDERLRTQVEQLRTVAVTTDDTAGDAPADEGASGDDLVLEDFASVEEYLQTAVARLVPARNEGSAAIVDGEVRFRPTTLSGFDIADDSELVEAVLTEVEDAGGTVLGTVSTEHGTLRYIAIPVEREGDPASGVYVRAVDLDAELQPVMASMITFGAVALAVVVAIGFVAWFVAGRLLSPIRHLRDAADTITLADLSPRLKPQGNDDISDMTRTVNEMLDRLEGSVDVQRQLLDDVRHELKTPITIVRGHLEMMNPDDRDDVIATRDIGMAELDRMTRLVSDIDLLATVEGDEFDMKPVSLAVLTARIGELVAVIPGHRWRIEHTARGKVVGDEDRLLQAWLQLADNAAKYTPDGSPIEIGSTLEPSGARLWVRDHGAGIPRAQRHRIFRRFDRAQGARPVGGSGLGLAIVDAIAKGHGGHCQVTDTSGGGATFTIHLPSPTSELPAPVRAGDVLQREASS